MFLFRDRKGEAPDGEAAQTQSDPGHHEFFAFKAARFLGGAARQVGASIARIAAGPSAESLAVELEARARSAEALGAAAADWTRLLAEEAPRFESGGPAGNGAPPLSFRGAFLRSQAFELALLTAGGSSPGGAEVWRRFLRAVVLPGGEGLALRLSQLLASAPERLQHHLGELAWALKADARSEQLRGERSRAGSRAERIHGHLREAPSGGRPAPEDLCNSSYEAVGLYASVRSALDKAVTQNHEALLQKCKQVEAASEALWEIGDAAAGQETAALRDREQAQEERTQVAAGLRREVEGLEQDYGRKTLDGQASELNDRKRQLQVKFEEVSKALATKRDERLRLLRRRDEAIGDHRRRTEAIEQQIRELMPSTFHCVMTPRVDAMTEGETVNGLSKAADSLQDLAGRLKVAAEATAAQGQAEIQNQVLALGQTVQSSLQRHVRLELSRLEAASSTVTSMTQALQAIAHAHAEELRRGSPDTGQFYSSLPQRCEVRRLGSALLVARAAWDGASDCGASGSASPATEAEVSSALEAARARISGSLIQLQQADPLLYDIVLDAVGEDGEEAAEEIMGGPDLEDHAPLELPHGWQAHAAPDGSVYYYSLVTRESQWEVPTQDAAVCAGWRLFQAENGMWFYHNPYDGEGVWWPDLPRYAAAPTSLDVLARDAQLASG